jgi:BirA family biotin operon repressor/biotin-[acetyl-CoA-carboxylase] ligase
MGWLGQPRRHFAVCTSTNDEAAAWARAGAPAGALVTADEQTRGRGRLGRAWHSPLGDALYFSTVLRPPLPPHRLPPLTLAAGVAVAETIATVGVEARLKWPNDLLVDGRKVAGILAEMSCVGDRVSHLVIGIGVNLNMFEFPRELQSIATSLRIARGSPVDRDAFTDELCARLAAWHDRFVAEGTGELVRAWSARADFFGRRVTVSAGRERLTGVAEALDDDGALRLRGDDGVLVRVIAGELT